MRQEAGNTSMRTPRATFLPFRMAAALARSSRRPLVQEPMTICCTLIPLAALIGLTLSTVCGKAICGSSLEASISITWSYTASASGPNSCGMLFTPASSLR